MDSGWKVSFIDAVKSALPADIDRQLGYDTNYTNPKKVRVSRAKDDLTILYVASNGNYLEFGLPILHHLLLSGMKIAIRTKGVPIYLSKSGLVPNITIEVSADHAAQWIRERADLIAEGISRFDEALAPDIRDTLLLHFGAETGNGSKAKADGVCRVGEQCIYCRALA